MIWHHISTWVCGLARGHMERRRGLALVFTLRIQLDCKHSRYRWHEFQKLMGCELEARKETKQSQVLTRSWMWSGSELVVVVVWIGSGSVWIRVWIGLEVDSHVCVCCSLDADGKKRTTRCAGSKCAAWLLGRLALQLATVSAWQFDSLDVQQLQLGCWTA